MAILGIHQFISMTNIEVRNKTYHIVDASAHDDWTMALCIHDRHRIQSCHWIFNFPRSATVIPRQTWKRLRHGEKHAAICTGAEVVRTLGRDCFRPDKGSESPSTLSVNPNFPKNRNLQTVLRMVLSDASRVVDAVAEA